MNHLEDFIPYGRQRVSEEDIEVVVQILRSPYLTQGPKVPEFERTVAAKVGASHGVAVNSATSALHIACMALGLGPKDRLWTSPITFVASANCARYCGAEVDFVDIDPLTGLMCVNALEEKLKKSIKDNSLPKVVVPVHLCGTSCDMKAIASLAEKYGFHVLEDASHAIGGSYDGQVVGNCFYSTITVFSFHPVKIITTGEGGIATTNNAIIAQKMEELRSHGITKDASRFEYPAPGPWSYEQQDLGFNYRMTEMQAALGLNQILRLDDIVNERNALFQKYQKKLEDAPIEFLQIPINVKSALHLAVVRLRDNRQGHHRSTFEYMRNQNIGVQVHYTPVHLQPYYRRLGFTHGDFPEAEKYATNALSIPLYPGLTEEEQNRVCEALKIIL
tara:strand:+ start:3218 stop:4387 length:1170 start_codon:yes stop_codon:yes gene_type:complete